jgi:hypothetical protein
VNPMVNEELIQQIASRVRQRVEAEQLAHQPSSQLSPLSAGPPVMSQSRARRAEPEDAPSPAEFFAPWTGEAFSASGSATVYPPQPRPPAAHPSQEQFTIAEAADIKSAVNELVEFFETQRCTIEKDKPCDHCGACRTLGF